MATDVPPHFPPELFARVDDTDDGRFYDFPRLVTHVDDATIGVLGVIGPTRMAYDRVVPIVDVTARLLESALGQGQQG